MSLIEQARALETSQRIRGPKCRVCAFIDSLGGLGAEVVELLAHEPRISTQSVIDTLAAQEQVDADALPTVSNFDRHRRGRCDPRKRPSDG